jgi:hypothetical protein
MKRRLDRKKRKLIVVGGLLAAALVLASAFLVGSGAVFTASSANPSNVWSAGTLTQSNSNEGAAIMSPSLLKPGDVKTGTVTIGNVGTIAANGSNTYTFTVTFPDNSTPASDTTGDNAYQGSSTTVEFDWTAVQS